MKNAPILILDEITASLDVENEKRIQESLNRLIQDKTVLIISHRLKSIEKVNKIVVMDQGKVVDQGTHSELYRRSEIYKNLIKKTKLSEKFVYEKKLNHDDEIGFKLTYKFWDIVIILFQKNNFIKQHLILNTRKNQYG